MIGRLPESWIPPDHLLDLRAQVRLRHTLVDQRGEWQQRIQAVLYHHGFPQRNGLLTAENRAWLAGSRAARARSRAGHRRADDDRCARCAVGADHPPAAPLRATPDGLQGVDEALRHRRADRGRRSSPSSATPGASRPRATPSATPAWTSPSINPTSAAPRATSHARGRQRCAGRCSKPPRPRADPAPRTAPTTTRPPTASAATAPASRWRANCSSAASTRCASSATTHCCPPDQSGARHSPRSPRCTAAAPRMLLPPPTGGRPPKTERPQRVLREDPITHHVADPRQGRGPR